MTIILIVALGVFLFSGQVQSSYKISEFKYELFRQDKLEAFSKFEYQNLDENFFENDYTRAPRYYNTSKCLKNLQEIRANLENHDKQSMMCKMDYFVCESKR